MAKMSICVEMIFTDSPFLERLDRVKNVGLSAFEFWGWRDKDLEKIKETANRLSLSCSGMGMDISGALADPKTDKEKMVQEFKETLKTAAYLKTPVVFVTTGNEIPGISRERQHKSVVGNLSLLAPFAEKAGITLALEPLNALVNHKGYYLSSSAEGFDIIKEVNSPNVKLLYDVYHQQITEGNLIQNITSNLNLIGHLHIADVPGRYEPGTGEINYANVLKAIDYAGYKGCIGMEFSPSLQPHEKSLELILKIARELHAPGE